MQPLQQRDKPGLDPDRVTQINLQNLTPKAFRFSGQHKKWPHRFPANYGHAVARKPFLNVNVDLFDPILAVDKYNGPLGDDMKS
jgi:hypothetical protein